MERQTLCVTPSNDISVCYIQIQYEGNPLFLLPFLLLGAAWQIPQRDLKDVYLAEKLPEEKYGEKKYCEKKCGEKKFAGKK